MNAAKPIASLSLDLDNQWSYMKTHGDTGWESFPSYLDVVVPRVLDFLKASELIITFFIVGQDAALKKNREALAAIAAGGHEIGNHSFHHEPWLQLYSEEQLEIDFAKAEEHIECATGQRPIGFRGPGFTFSPMTLQVLARRGYIYDASTFPTFLGPMARAYYLMTTKLNPEQKREREFLFGNLNDGLRSNKPYRWRVTKGALVEIPVTTMPFFRIPIHASYVLYLSMYSRSLALSYFRAALTLCRATGVQPSLLLHPLDFVDSDDIHALSFFPAMKLRHDKKLEIVREILQLLSQYFTIVNLRQHALEVSAAPSLPVVGLSF